jgi:hypothetical protein
MISLGSIQTYLESQKYTIKFLLNFYSIINAKMKVGIKQE